MLSLEYLKELAELAKEAVEAEREVVPEDEQDLGKAALTELFEGTRNENTPIIVERVVADIDDIVEKVRFPEWQHTDEGERDGKAGPATRSAQVQAPPRPGTFREGLRLHQAVLLRGRSTCGVGRAQSLARERAPSLLEHGRHPK